MMQIINLTAQKISFQQDSLIEIVTPFSSDSTSFFPILFSHNRNFNIYQNNELLHQSSLPIGDGGGIYSMVVRENSIEYITSKDPNQKFTYINFIKAYIEEDITTVS